MVMVEELVLCIGRPALRLLGVKGARGIRGTRGNPVAQPGLENVDGGRRSSGAGGGEGTDPSTWSITAQSAGEAGDAAFLFFSAWSSYR